MFRSRRGLFASPPPMATPPGWPSFRADRCLPCPRCARCWPPRSTNQEQAADPADALFGPPSAKARRRAALDDGPRAANVTELPRAQGPDPAAKPGILLVVRAGQARHQRRSTGERASAPSPSGLVLRDSARDRLRDTFAVALLAQGVSIEDVCSLLGHGSIRTTERYYAPWDRRRRERLRHRPERTGRTQFWPAQNRLVAPPELRLHSRNEPQTRQSTQGETSIGAALPASFSHLLRLARPAA